MSCTLSDFAIFWSAVTYASTISCLSVSMIRGIANGGAAGGGADEDDDQEEAPGVDMVDGGWVTTDGAIVVEVVVVDDADDESVGGRVGNSNTPAAGSTENGADDGGDV